MTVPDRTFFWRMLAHCVNRLFAENDGFQRFLTDQIRKKAASGAGGRRFESSRSDHHHPSEIVE